MNHKILPCLLAATLAAVALPAAAQSAGEWTLGIGIHNVDPKSNNGTLANGTLPLSSGSSLCRPSDNSPPSSTSTVRPAKSML